MSTKLNIITALATILGITVMVMPSQAETFDGRRAIIIDGDTIAIGSERVRILNVDAPESFRPRCEAELVAGLKAKERLAQLLRGGSPYRTANPWVQIERHGKDRYRRTLARLILTDGQVSNAGNSGIKGRPGISGNEARDVGEILIAEGLALPWRDGREAWEARKRHWCESSGF